MTTFPSTFSRKHGLSQPHSQWVTETLSRGDNDYSPPPRVEVQNTWSYTSRDPYVLWRAREELYLHARSPHSRKVTPLRTPATWHVSEQNPHTSCILRRLPDMHLTGESLARRLTTPLCQGRLTDQYTPAGGRSLGALLFYMSPGRTFDTRPHGNSVSRPHSVFSMYFTSLERGPSRWKTSTQTTNLQTQATPEETTSNLRFCTHHKD
jgi:hypothetical protein